MVQTDLPLTLIENIDKLFIDVSRHNEPRNLLTERYEKENTNPQYYLSKEFLFNKSIVDSSEYKKLVNIFPCASSYRVELEDFLLKKGFELTEKLVSGCFFYPLDGFMSWHTNFKRQDWRIYIVKSLQGDSFFRYTENEEMITEYDPVGYSYRIFNVGDENSPFWHCVYGGSGRYSVGFRLKRILS